MLFGKLWPYLAKVAVPDFAGVCSTEAAEQRVIAGFLDRHTARLDALAAAKERLLTLLAEQRQAAISRAVTRGLDPAAPLRDSGVPWLGAIPAHWAVKKLGWLVEVFNGATPSQLGEDFWADGTIPWVASGEVSEAVVTTPTAMISREAFESAPLRMVPAGSILIGMIGPGRTRGAAAVLSFAACINQNVAAVVPGRELHGGFLRYALAQAYGPIRQIGRGGNQAALNCQLVRGVPIPHPPLSEQQQIADRLDEFGRRTAAQSERVRLHIEMLHEYRAALIAAAVTGRIDVREEVAPA